ncbi:uncharacterized protein CTRU02_206371 [Colletotrichum truncatum]|uniref:Uncharacterized protein n=1 Tax=Colletotrichum truncatum TaxID=5467 RepID=A0ACC3Z6P1_COLTU
MNQKAMSQKGQKLLVTFTYYESVSARANLKYFLKHGLHDAADFVFIFNGDTPQGQEKAAKLIPKRNNIKIVERNNTCFDLGATGEVLKKNKMWKKYDKFIVMNASLRGPFLPHWSDSCWSDLFLAKVTDEVKLVGITANCYPRFHVQSMIWATDRIGMELLLDPFQGLAASVGDGWGSREDLVGLGGCYNEYIKAIHAEIGSTSIITGAGYKVDVMMTSYHGISTPDPRTYCTSIPSHVQDTLREGEYFGFTIHPYETIFIKTNRNINPAQIEHLSRWMGNGGYTSYEKCKATRRA